jgi:hypothetical protein
MLDNHLGSNEESLLNRISQVRNPSEPNEPTEVEESLEVTPEEVEAESVEELATDEVELEAEELDESAPQIEESEEFYVDIDGREISFSDIKEWEQGNLRQSDYTRKTQEVADKRKALEAQEQSLTSKTAELDEKIAMLDTYIAEFDTSEIDGMSLDELRDLDPGQYLKVKEDQEKRKAALEAAKNSRSTLSSEEMQAKQNVELSKLIKNNPQWIKDGKETENYQNDMSMVMSYLDKLGYDDASKQGILTNGHGQVFLDAARFNASKKANASIAKKVRKAPTVTKPSGASKSQASLALEKAREHHKKVGTPESALALRKAQRKFKGE